MPSPDLALWGLLHDAAEAFIGDVVKPLKVRLPDFAEVEARVEAAVLATFGLSGPMPAAVKAADRAMLRVEQKAVMRNSDCWHWTEQWADPFGPEPVIQFLQPDDAYELFMHRAGELGLGA